MVDVSRTIEEFCDVVRSGHISYMYCLFSGGRDSLAALHLSKSVGERLKVPVEAVYVDTTISTPGNLEYVEEVCGELGVKLSVARPKSDYFTLVNKWGFPTATRRWCCYHLKVRPLREFFRARDVAGAMLVDGIRREESTRRRGFPKIGLRFKMLCYHPIFEWSKQDVLDYIKAHGLRENPLYAMFPRAVECWCPAFKSVEQFRMLKRNFPELFNRLVEAEAKLKGGGSALYKRGRRIYLKDLK